MCVKRISVTFSFIVFICISRWLLFMWLITIPHTTSLSNENCNSDRYNEGEGSDNKECDGARKTEQPSLKYTEMEG